MSGVRDTGRGGLFPQDVLRQLDKENINTTNVTAGRTPERRRGKANAGFKVFQAEGDESRPSTIKKDNPSSQLEAELSLAKSEAAKYKEEFRLAQRALDGRNERVRDLKSTTASTNLRYTALLKSHEEANKELGLLRTQLVNGGGGDGNVERLKARIENLETNNELLREERNSLEARLAKREAAMAGTKTDLAAAAQRESALREEAKGLREELDGALRDATSRADAQNQAASDAGAGQAQWTLEKASLDAQVGELEAQLSASGRRCASVVAERAVLAEEATRRENERDSAVAALQDELRSLHHRTSADLGDWQRRHREAVGARKAVEAQLERLVGASKSVALVAEKQAALEASLQEACGLLSQAVLAEGARRDGGAGGLGPDSTERVVEGVLENILGGVVERVKEGGADEEEEEERREQEAERVLQEATAMLRGTLENLSAEMASLREYGEAEADVFQERAQSLEAELEDVCGRHAEAVSELEAARGKAEHEVAQLTQRLDERDGERKDLELRLESAAQELATTVQLSELALAARVSAAEDERLEKERKLVAEKTRLAEELEAQDKARLEELDFVRRDCAGKVDAVEEENRSLQDKLEGLAAQALELKERADARSEQSPPDAGVSAEDWAARERELLEMEARLVAVVAQNNELEKTIEASSASASAAGERVPPSPGREERQAKIVALESEVAQLRDSVAAEKERVARAKEDDERMRKYVIYHNTRCEQKMKEMQKRLVAKAAERPAVEP